MKDPHIKKRWEIFIYKYLDYFIEYLTNENTIWKKKLQKVNYNKHTRKTRKKKKEKNN